MQSKCSLSYRLHSAFGNQSITFDIYLTLCFDKHALNINNRMIDNNLHYKKTANNCKKTAYCVKEYKKGLNLQNMA